MRIAWGEVLVWLLWGSLPLGALAVGWGVLHLFVSCISGVGAGIGGGIFALAVIAVSLLLGLSLGFLLPVRGSRIGGGVGAALSPIVVFAAFFFWFHHHTVPEPFGPDWCYAEPYQDP